MPTFKIILYKSKTLFDGTHPVMLQVINKRRIFKISLGYKCSRTEWDEAKNRFKSKYQGYKKKNSILLNVEQKADDIIDTIEKQGKDLTPALFKQLFNNEQKDVSVFEFFKERIQELDERDKVGNKRVYTDTKNAVKNFWKGNKTLMFSDVDYQFLQKFETYLHQRGCSGGGISIYMRTLRALINEAIKRGIMDKDFYPFHSPLNRNGYSIAHLKSKASPKALSLADMDKFKNFSTEKYPELKEAHLFFLFSYYARGMNFKDMVSLKQADIYNDRINYTRRKTGRFMSIKLSEKLQTIINEFLTPDQEYVFPILSDFHQTEKQKENRIKKALKKLNQQLKQIGELCEIKVPITSYVARHTFATTLKSKKADISLISESMGHVDVATTKAYLKRFENSEIDELDELL